MKKFRLLRTTLLLGALAVLLVVSLAVALTKQEVYTIYSADYGKEGVAEFYGKDEFAIGPDELPSRISVGSKKVDAYLTAIEYGGVQDTDVYTDPEAGIVYKLGRSHGFAVLAEYNTRPLMDRPEGQTLSQATLCRMAEETFAAYQAAPADLKDYEAVVYTTLYLDVPENGAYQKTVRGLPEGVDAGDVSLYTLEYVKVLQGEYESEAYAKFIFNRNGDLLSYFQEPERDWDTVRIDSAKLERSLAQYMGRQRNGRYRLASYQVTARRVSCDSYGVGYMTMTVECVWQRRHSALTEMELRIRLE